MISRHVVRIALIAAVAALALVPTALAGKGGGGKPGGGGGGTTTSSSLSLVLLNSSDGQAHWGQQVTFNVATTATASPFVSLNCYQGSTWVLTASAGFFPSYPWSRDFTLSSGSWPSGAADCTARLYMTKDGSRTTTLATLSFHVSS
jgi:hypothetical protein